MSEQDDRFKFAIDLYSLHVIFKYGYALRKIILKIVS